MSLTIDSNVKRIFIKETNCSKNMNDEDNELTNITNDSDKKVIINELTTNGSKQIKKKEKENAC
jgi:hypothetical protein